MELSLTFNIVVVYIFGVFFLLDKKKAKEALNFALKALKTIGPILVIMIILLVFMQQFFSKEDIAKYIAASTGYSGYFTAAFLGAIIHIPFFIAFPIGGQLLHSGVNPGFIAVLITSLVMVHLLSIPIEIKELGLKFALVRNILSLVFAIFIGITIGVLY